MLLAQGVAACLVVEVQFSDGFELEKGNVSLQFAVARTEVTTYMFWCAMDVDIEVMVRLCLEEPLADIVMLLGCVSDVDLPAIRPHELSKASSVVAMNPKMMVRSCGSTVGITISVAVVVEGRRRRDLADRRESGRVAFLEIRVFGFTVPRLPVGSWTTKEDLPGHLVRHNCEVRPQAASAAYDALCTVAGRGAKLGKVNLRR